MRDLQEAHIIILDTLNHELKADISDFEKYKILKSLLYEIDEVLIKKTRTIIIYRTDTNDIEVRHNQLTGEYIVINDSFGLDYETYKDICTSFKYVEEKIKEMKKNENT